MPFGSESRKSFIPAMSGRLKRKGDVNAAWMTITLRLKHEAKQQDTTCNASYSYRNFPLLQVD
jgi:hypothetical protein